MAAQHGTATENIFPDADTFTVYHADYNFGIIEDHMK